MAATFHDISGWFDQGVAQKAQFMVVVCDGFDHEDYPCYAEDAAECLKTYDEHNGKQMQRVMEVYDLSLPKDAQMHEHRAMHLPPRERFRIS
jgi:hypothetical protein